MNNFSGNFQQGSMPPPPGVPFLPANAPSAESKLDAYNASKALSKGELKKTLQRLTQVSYDMESTGKSLSMTQNIVQHRQLSDKMDGLAKEQAQLLKKIVDTSDNAELKKKFLALSQKIGEYQQKIKNCKTKEELDQQQKNIDSTVDAWVNLFQDIAMDAIKSSKL